MATATKYQLHCATCNKATGTFSCRGCGKDFCLKHTNGHRQELNKRMDENVILFHDQVKQQIQEQVDNCRQHPLIKQIDQWENESIKKISLTAKQYREELFSLLDERTAEITDKIQILTKQLKTARDDDYFFENDLKQWINQLQELKTDIDTPKTIHIRNVENRDSLISKIVIDELQSQSEEDFEQTVGNIRISDDRKVVIHNDIANYGFVYGRCDYSRGKHSIRFRIKSISQHKWAFVGVISKNTSNDIPSNRPTPNIYGFGGQNAVWCNGDPQQNLNGYTSDFRVNDGILLDIDCNLRQLVITNRRAKTRHSLNINIAKCPLPWKLCIGFYYSPGESIQIF